MTRNIWIGIVVVLVLVAGGWWYFNQSSVPPTSETTQLPEQTTQQNTNTPPATTQTQPKAGEYSNTEFGISFTHPTNWYCKTYRGVTSRPNWNQTICDDETDGSYRGDPLVVIDVPLESFPTGGDVIEVRHTSIAGQNSSVIKVTVNKSDLYPSIGSVEYTFVGSSGAKSFAMEAGYGTGKPYATAEEVEKVLNPIAHSLLVK